MEACCLFDRHNGRTQCFVPLFQLPGTVVRFSAESNCRLQFNHGKPARSSGNRALSPLLLLLPVSASQGLLLGLQPWLCLCWAEQLLFAAWSIRQLYGADCWSTVEGMVIFSAPEVQHLSQRQLALEPVPKTHL